MHSVPKGSETHFKVVVVSEAFQGVSLVDRHKTVNNLLAPEFSTGLHALSILAKTPEQWDKSSKVDPSPACLGGMKHETKQKQ
jgi:BolA protein